MTAALGGPWPMVSGCCRAAAGRAVPSLRPAVSLVWWPVRPSVRLAASGENPLCARGAGRLSGQLLDSWKGDVSPAGRR